MSADSGRCDLTASTIVLGIPVHPVPGIEIGGAVGGACTALLAVPDGGQSRIIGCRHSGQHPLLRDPLRIHAVAEGKKFLHAVGLMH
jgi:hypothetical protein